MDVFRFYKSLIITGDLNPAYLVNTRTRGFI